MSWLKRLPTKALAPLFVLLLVSGCFREKPIVNINDETFPLVVAEKLTVDEVAKAISTAGYTRKESWNFTRVSENEFTAELNVRNKHNAVVRIPFNTERFSVLYESSNGLLYDGVRIHYNYNKWVANLSRDIKQAVMQAANAK